MVPKVIAVGIYRKDHLYLHERWDLREVEEMKTYFDYADFGLDKSLTQQLDWSKFVRVWAVLLKECMN